MPASISTLTQACSGGNVEQRPTGKDLPENQCVFIRGFRVARTLKILPKHLKAAADPPQDSDGNDYEPERELISIPAATTVKNFV
ncbi:hypothetical protein BC826DRAFT_366579 [Russula brevipes]|nr:hypothetical protein BC826DRAFT_366579 [Russula brevipes]